MEVPEISTRQDLDAELEAQRLRRIARLQRVARMRFRWFAPLFVIAAAVDVGAYMADRSMMTLVNLGFLCIVGIVGFNSIRNRRAQAQAELDELTATQGPQA